MFRLPLNVLAALLTGTLIGCGPQGGGDSPSASATTPAVTVLGGGELRIQAVDTAAPNALVTWDGPAATTKTPAQPTVLPSGIDMRLLETSVFDLGTRGVDGRRYLSARFQVRNASACLSSGTCPAYAGMRRNLSFVGALDKRAVAGTALTSLTLSSGYKADPALALLTHPTHGMKPGGAGRPEVIPTQASLQVFTEAEAALITPPDLATAVFPYGFVVRNVNQAGTRSLPGNPGAYQFDGEVTFAFSLPLQDKPTNDPASFTFRFQMVDDTNTRVTESREEQDVNGDYGSAARAMALGSRDHVVLGGRLARTGAGNPICAVRTAGTAVAPTAFLANAPATTAPYAAPVNLNNLPVDNTPISLGYCDTLDKIGKPSLIVWGSQSGRRVPAPAAYSGAVSGGVRSATPNQVVMTIAGRPFFPGERVSFTLPPVAVTQAGAALTPFAGSFLVAGSLPGTAGAWQSPVDLVPSTLPTLTSFAIGDLNGDGKLDLVVADSGHFNQVPSLFIYTGNGGGAFAANGAVAVPSPQGAPFQVQLADIDGDGLLDAVTGYAGSIAVLRGNGAGSLGPASVYPASNGTVFTLADFNNDGRIDLFSIPDWGAGGVPALLPGNGSGGFLAPIAVAIPGVATERWYEVEAGDLNADGNIDVVITGVKSPQSRTVVLLGKGNGQFNATNAPPGLAGNYGIAGPLVDLDGDGHLDLVLSGFNSETRVFFGGGDGSFPASKAPRSGAFARQVAVGDLDGDGRPDLVALGVNGTERVETWRNAGARSFTTTGSYPTGGYLPGYQAPWALADLDNDRKLDLVLRRGYGAGFSTTLTSLRGY